MGTGNQSEAEIEVTRPDEVVVTDSETTKAKPQAEATEDTETYVEDESDNQETSHKDEMSQAKAYAMFKAKQKQSARRKEEIDKGNDERAAMQATIDELQATVGKITKGAPPTLESCDYDEGQFSQKMQEYYSNPGKPAQKEAAKPDAPNKVQNDEAEYNLYQQEQALTKDLPDYEDAKASFINTVKTKYGVKDPSTTIAMIADISKQSGVDAAKAIFAMNKVPALIDELNSCTNPFAMAKVLEKAAAKVKSRVKAPITTQPEPDVTNSGPIDNSAGTIDKLYKAWQEKPSLANHKRYIAAKNKK
ncbi:MAG: hypothetical protein COA78_21065 [Blastopirellula sp.]|nr:MAG: hypothetical protein COA78_21065 [Blastopirellula sp.]